MLEQYLWAQRYRSEYALPKAYYHLKLLVPGIIGSVIRKFLGTATDLVYFSLFSSSPVYYVLRSACSTALQALQTTSDNCNGSGPFSGHDLRLETRLALDKRV